MATTAKIAKDLTQTPKFARPAPQPLPQVRPAARLSAQVRAVPPLLPRARARGRSRGRDQEQLVEQTSNESKELSMTDPIADMLTRIRNAVHARHPRVDMPASRFKAEIAQHPRAGGLHPGLQASSKRRRRPTPQAPCIRIVAEIRPARRERHRRASQRVSRPGPPRLLRPRRRAEGAWADSAPAF